jgi:hypothetical protein
MPDSIYSGDINIDQLSEGIWFFSKEKKTMLARKIGDLPKAVIAAQMYPIQNELCNVLRTYLRRCLPKDTFEEYIVPNKVILHLYDIVLKTIQKHELADENVVKQIEEDMDVESEEEVYEMPIGRKIDEM